MMKRFTVYISDKEFEALKGAADGELRDYRDQARILIKSELERRGLLIPEGQKTKGKTAAGNGTN